MDQCLAKTFGPSMFLSTDGRGDCYTCRTAVTANESGYTLYTKSGAVEGTWAAASDGCTDKQGCTTQHGLFADALYAQVIITLTPTLTPILTRTLNLTLT